MATKKYKEALEICNQTIPQAKKLNNLFILGTLYFLEGFSSQQV
jgi:hypothetical protein